MSESQTEKLETTGKLAGPKRLGTLLAIASFLIAAGTLAVWVRQMNLVAIPEDRTLFMVGFLGAAAMGIASFVIGTRWYGGIVAVVATLIGAFMPFTAAISPQKVADNPIQVGDTIPYFRGIDDEGETFTSTSLAGTPVMIKFFRAHW